MTSASTYRSPGNPVHESVPGAPWQRHPDERWIVGDPGRQAEMVPFPAELAFSRPDTTIDGARLGAVEYRAVSLRGQSHWAKRQPRQDAYLLRITSNEQWLVGCVADGVSESPYSHMAADIACREITRHITEALDGQPAIIRPEHWQKMATELPWQDAVDQASTAMTAKAKAAFPALEQAAPLDPHVVRATLATTAVGFAVPASAAEDGRLPFVVMVAAGDSSALVLSRSRWHPITALKDAKAETVSNAVRALPREVAVTPTVGFLAPGEALMVVTDGIGDPLGSGTGEVGQFLAARWSRPPDLLAFAAHAGFYRKGFTDDRTAAVIWHGAGPGRLGEPEKDQVPMPSEATTDAARPPAADSIDLAVSWSGEEGTGD
jgi:protein phosphatase 2C-like protein